MAKYIDADKMADELSKVPWYERDDEKQAIRMVKEFPATDVQEVRHGRWNDSKVAFHRVCSECGAVVRQDVSLVYLLECMEKVGALNYCPNCGARMMDEVTE